MDASGGAIRRISETGRTYIGAGFVAVVTLLVYIPGLRNGFVNWDDQDYVYANSHIHSLGPDLFRWAFFDFHASGNWHPLTSISHALDYAVWTLNPFGHHLTSILLHAANAFVLVVLLTRLLKSLAAGGDVPRPALGDRRIAGVTLLTGLLFGLHPIHVESVAWISERKDVLYALFYLLGLLAYVSYATADRRLRNGSPVFFFCDGRYLLTAGCFCLSIMSKPMAITFPFVLLILDWHPFGRMSDRRSALHAVLEKTPFLVLCAGSAVLTFLAQRAGDTIVGLARLPLSVRIPVAIESLSRYLLNLVWPFRLAPHYPHPGEAPLLSVEFVASTALLVGVTAACVALARRQRVWLAAWAFYIVSLVPVLGLVQVGNQALADRYMYLPAVGPFLVFALVVTAPLDSPTTSGSRRFWGTALVVTVAVAASAVLAPLTTRQIRIWKDGATLWGDLIERPPPHLDVSKAYGFRGDANAEYARFDEALRDYSDAIRLSQSPEFALDCRLKRVSMLTRLKRYAEAVEDCSRALDLEVRSYPREAILVVRASLLAKTGRPEDALADYGKAIGVNPRYARAYRLRGALYAKLGRRDDAAKDLATAERLRPRPVDLGAKSQ